MLLKNIQLTFGETASSPKVLSIASVNTLIKAIEDPNVNARFSGHIISETGSLNAAQAYTLATAGITFHGNITPVDFTLSANKTTVADGSEIILTATGVPAMVLDFSVASVTIDSGTITADEVKALCVFSGDRLIINPAGVKTDWQATILVKATTRYTPASEKTASIVVRHKAYSTITPGQTSINFDTPKSVTIPLTFGPVDANVPIESVRATLQSVSPVYEITGVSNSAVTIRCISVGVLNINNVVLEATDATGKVITGTIAISNKVVPSAISIDGESEFVAPNGEGSSDYTFRFTPENFNVAIELVSVTPDNPVFTVTNQSASGFTLSVSGTTADVSTTVTAVLRVDGLNKTVKKIVTARWEEVISANGHEYVDLGLPSGLLWAKMNVGADSETAYGKFFMWGDTEGEDMTGKSAPSRTYNWTYYDTQPYGRNKLDANITPKSGFDACRANMGGTWRMPTKDEYQELYDNTISEGTTINGVNGRKFTSKTNPDAYIFLPAAGNVNGTTWSNKGSNGRYWSSSLNPTEKGYYIYFNNSSVTPQNSIARYYGYTCRGVL